MKKLVILSLFILPLLFLTGCDDSESQVSISLPSGTYYGEQKVTLTCADPNAQILYTLDGSDPGSSELVYNPETGITVSFTSDLKATAGGDVSQAHYDIVPYDTKKDANQQNFVNTAIGSYATDDTETDKFVLSNSEVTFYVPGQPEYSSGYYLKDVNGNNATLIYTDQSGKNQEVTLSYDPENYVLTVNGKPYTALWMLQ